MAGSAKICYRVSSPFGNRRLVGLSSLVGAALWESALRLRKILRQTGIVAARQRT
jgi:hypothetical protein